MRIALPYPGDRWSQAQKKLNGRLTPRRRVWALSRRCYRVQTRISPVPPLRPAMAKGQSRIPSAA